MRAVRQPAQSPQGQELIHHRADALSRISIPHTSSNISLASIVNHSRMHQGACRRGCPSSDGVVLSFVLRGGLNSIGITLRNAFVFTERAPMLLHVNANIETSRADWYVQAVTIWLKDICRKDQRHRMIRNPKPIVVEKGTASVLAAHLSNFAHCVSPGQPCSLPGSSGMRVVFMATNQLLFRSGLEQWVSQHPLSFCAGDCTTVGDINLVAGRLNGSEIEPRLHRSLDAMTDYLRRTSTKAMRAHSKSTSQSVEDLPDACEAPGSSCEYFLRFRAYLSSRAAAVAWHARPQVTTLRGLTPNALCGLAHRGWEGRSLGRV